MAADRIQRRLASILAADVVGYSRLMGEDEVGTLAALSAHRAALIDPNIAEHQGRIVKTTGDGMLVEFPSIVDALRCAVNIQLAMPQREAGSNDPIYELWVLFQTAGVLFGKCQFKLQREWDHGYEAEKDF